MVDQVSVVWGWGFKICTWKSSFFIFASFLYFLRLLEPIIRYYHLEHGFECKVLCGMICSFKHNFAILDFKITSFIVYPVVIYLLTDLQVSAFSLPHLKGIYVVELMQGRWSTDTSFVITFIDLSGSIQPMIGTLFALCRFWFENYNYWLEMPPCPLICFHFMHHY
jgi:hypothetical protein